MPQIAVFILLSLGDQLKKVVVKLVFSIIFSIKTAIAFSDENESL